MKNFEKYIDEFSKRIESCLGCNGIYRIVHHKMCKCEEQVSSRYCEKCEFYNMNSKQWLLAEYQEPIKLSHDEYVILKNLPKDCEWITRNRYGDLLIYREKPYKSVNIWDCDNDDGCEFYAFNHLFQFIKWEDEEPYEIAKLIADYERENEDEANNL